MPSTLCPRVALPVQVLAWRPEAAYSPAPAVRERCLSSTPAACPGARGRGVHERAESQGAPGRPANLRASALLAAALSRVDWPRARSRPLCFARRPGWPWSRAAGCRIQPKQLLSCACCYESASRRHPPALARPAARAPGRPVRGAQVRARQLWGNIVYTQDSDLVAVLMHNGFYNHALQQPPAGMAEARRPRVPAPPMPCAAAALLCVTHDPASNSDGSFHLTYERSPCAARQSRLLCPPSASQLCAVPCAACATVPSLQG
jgi:hypothetical protein